MRHTKARIKIPEFLLILLEKSGCSEGRMCFLWLPVLTNKWGDLSEHLPVGEDTALNFCSDPHWPHFLAYRLIFIVPPLPNECDPSLCRSTDPWQAGMAHPELPMSAGT